MRAAPSTIPNANTALAPRLGRGRALVSSSLSGCRTQWSLAPCNRSHIGCDVAVGARCPGFAHLALDGDLHHFALLHRVCEWRRRGAVRTSTSCMNAACIALFFWSLSSCSRSLASCCCQCCGVMHGPRLFRLEFVEQRLPLRLLPLRLLAKLVVLWCG